MVSTLKKSGLVRRWETKQFIGIALAFDLLVLLLSKWYRVLLRYFLQIFIEPLHDRTVFYFVITFLYHQSTRQLAGPELSFHILKLKWRTALFFWEILTQLLIWWRKQLTFTWDDKKSHYKPKLWSYLELRIDFEYYRHLRKQTLTLAYSEWKLFGFFQSVQPPAFCKSRVNFSSWENFGV